MKKVIFLLNQFRYSNGVARALIGLCNNMDLEKFDVTVKPIYALDKDLAQELDPRIKVEKAFGFYFRGFDKIASLLPTGLLYDKFIGGKYDIEVAFQCGIPTKMVGYSKNLKAIHAIWMHTFDMYEAEFSRADKVLCVSRCNAVRCKEIMGDSVNVDYCYNLVDDSIIKGASQEQIDFASTVKPVLVSVGRHSPEKGYLRLIKILRELRDEGWSFNLILVGDGSEHQKIAETINALQMSDWIKLVGSQVNPHKYTAKSDLFICSSFSEGYSTACTEAAILGIPIITTCVAGGEEIIADCECGSLTEMDDESLKNAIRRAVAEPELLNSWKYTMQRTSKKFGLEARKARANDFFDEFATLSDERSNI